MWWQTRRVQNTPCGDLDVGQVGGCRDENVRFPGQAIQRAERATFFTSPYSPKLKASARAIQGSDPGLKVR